MKTKNSLRPYDAALAEASKRSADFGKVLDLLNRAIKAGDARASYALGTWYLHGTHVRKDLARALRLIGDAAKANIPEALYDMAVSYEKGAGVRKNVKRALQFYLRASLSGDAQATFEVGRCFYHGIGVGQDRGLSRIWLARARELGAKP